VIAWDDAGLFSGAVNGGAVRPDALVALPTTSVGMAERVLRSWVDEADLIVTATRNAPAALFEALNRTCLEAGVPWLRANEAAGVLDLGPLVLPYDSACFTCMALREASTDLHAIEEGLYQEALASERPAGATPPVGEAFAAATLGASFIAMEVLRFLSGSCPPTVLNAVRSMTLLEGTLAHERLLRVPGCPDCQSTASPAQRTLHG
jgi:bacteriocin biosynthesis cyclodehydratase domain-containing protein